MKERKEVAYEQQLNSNIAYLERCQAPRAGLWLLSVFRSRGGVQPHVHIQLGARQWGMVRSQRVAAGRYPRQAWREVEWFQLWIAQKH